MSEEIIKAETLEYQYQPAIIAADFPAMRAKLETLIEPYSDITPEIVAGMDMKQAKSDRAYLKSMQTELNNARIAIEKEYDKPFKAFKSQVDALISMIKEPWSVLDAGIKEEERLFKQSRYDYLEQVYEEFAPALVPVLPFDRIIDKKWLNKGSNPETSLKKAENELTDKVAGIAAEWDVLKKTDLVVPTETELKFFETLSLREALAFDKERAEEIARLNDLKAQVEHEPEVPQITRPDNVTINDETLYKFTISVDAEFYATICEATAIKNLLLKNGIIPQMTKSQAPVEVSYAN